MTSSYSADLKLELMVTGENAGTWGDNTNNNLNLIQQAIAGFEQVTLSSGGTLALVMTDKTISNARNMVIKFATASIAASTICTIPDSIEKFYIFDATGLTNPANLTIKTASGTGFTLDAAKIYAAYSDGTNLKEISLDTLGGTVAAAQIADNAVTTAKILQSNVTTNKLASEAVRAANISSNAVTTAKILQSNVTLAKMAANSVGPSQLQSTAVTAGAYTTANITVDEDGRLTAASSGAGGDGGYVFADGTGTSGTDNISFVYTAHPTATKVVAYAIGAGGGGGQTPQSAPYRFGANGSNGGFGVYRANISAPYTQPFLAGSGGSGNSGTANGSAGGDSFFGPAPSPLLLATGGAGGPGTGIGTAPPGQVGGMPTGTTNLTITSGPGTGTTAIGKYRRRIDLFLGQNPVDGDGGGDSTFPRYGAGGDGGAQSPASGGHSGGHGAVRIYELIP